MKQWFTLLEQSRAPKTKKEVLAARGLEWLNHTLINGDDAPDALLSYVNNHVDIINVKNKAGKPLTTGLLNVSHDGDGRHCYRVQVFSTDMVVNIIIREVAMAIGSNNGVLTLK